MICYKGLRYVIVVKDVYVNIVVIYNWKIDYNKWKFKEFILNDN